MIPDPAINREPTSTAMDILNTQLPQDTIALWWLGQAGFVLRSSSSIVYLDPFLSEHPARLIPPLFAAEVGPPADLVLCTHEHWDHLDPQALRGLAQASLQARFVVPLPIVDQVTASMMVSASTAILVTSLRWQGSGCIRLAIHLPLTV